MNFAEFALCFFHFLTSINGANLVPKIEKHHQIEKRQLLNQYGTTGLGGGACPLGMPPPLGGTVQYSPNYQTGQFGASPLASTGLGPYPAGTTATMFCQGGMPMGPSTAVCMNGAWQPPMFSGCSLGGNSLSFPGSMGMGGIGQIGGQFGGIGGMAGGQIGAFGQMGAGQCLMGLTPPPGGLISYSTGGFSTGVQGQYPTGTVATLQCQNGQFPTGGSSSATCMNGLWQPSILGFCNAQNAFGMGMGINPLNPSLFSGMQMGGQQQQYCLTGVGLPLNGQVQYSGTSIGSIGPYPIGTMATLICNPGFIPSGQSTSTCQMGGQFVPPILGSCTMSGRKRR